jgi:hypothetical protein
MFLSKRKVKEYVRICVQHDAFVPKDRKKQSRDWYLFLVSSMTSLTDFTFMLDNPLTPSLASWWKNALDA